MLSDPTLDALEADFATMAQAASRGRSRARVPATLLHIGREHLVVLSGHGGRPESVQQLDLGATRVARDYLHHDPPMPAEIERAIDFAEDEIMRLGRRVDDVATQLISTSASLRAWRSLSDTTITIEIVEQWFQRLASAALGEPSALKGMPAGREAAATLLVLREFMHHQGHTSIVVTESPAAADRGRLEQAPRR